MSLDAVGQELGKVNLPHEVTTWSRATDLAGSNSNSNGIDSLHRWYGKMTALHLSMTVELEDFDPELIERHRRERKSTLKPCEGFALEAFLPAALLKLRRDLNL